MKVMTSKNKQTCTKKFEKFVLATAKKKNVKGGSDPIIFQDCVDI